MFSGLVNGIMSLFNTGANYALGEQAAERQFKYNKEMAAIQNQYNIDMWRMNNEYNTPKAQMERLREAGLNPNLAYGSVSTGNSSSVPEQIAPAPRKAVTPVFRLGGGMNLIDSYFDLQLKKEQIKQMQAQTDAIEKNAILTEQRTMNAADLGSKNQALFDAMNNLYYGIPLSDNLDRFNELSGYSRYLSDRNRLYLESINANYQNLGQNFHLIRSHKDYIQEQTDLLRKRSSDYRTDKLLERIGLGVDWFLRGLNTFKGFGTGSPAVINRTYNRNFNGDVYGGFYNY